jgi:hypothetical protein
MEKQDRQKPTSPRRLKCGEQLDQMQHAPTNDPARYRL